MVSATTDEAIFVYDKGYSMTRTKKPATVASFPALMTLGKLVRGKTPVEVLKAMDNMENVHGKKAMFNGKKILDKVRGFEVPDDSWDKNLQRVTFSQTFGRLESLGLIEGHPGNKYENHVNRTYRLTPQTRQALKYL